MWAGAYSTCSTTRSGAFFCWGANQAGQLGLGDRTERVYAPARLEKLAGPLIDMALGPNHGCALHASGALWCWGSNQSGQLGVSSITTRASPAKVEGLPALASVTVGNGHVCAADESGGVWCWGAGELGQLGQGNKSSSVPLRVPGITNAKRVVVAGHDHACALRGDGTVLCWGSNGRGQAGDGESGGNRARPVRVIGLPAVEHLVSGGNHTCALTKDGETWCWGSNHNAQIDGSGADQLPPVQLTALPRDTKKLTLGRAHTCARTADGRVYCWGRNNFGQLGSGGTQLKTGRPTVVPLACD